MLMERRGRGVPRSTRRNWPLLDDLLAAAAMTARLNRLR